MDSGFSLHAIAPPTSKHAASSASIPEDSASYLRARIPVETSSRAGVRIISGAGAAWFSSGSGPTQPRKNVRHAAWELPTWRRSSSSSRWRTTPTSSRTAPSACRPISGTFTFASPETIDRVPSLKARGSHAREALMNQQIDCRHYAYEEGIDLPEIVNWKWPL